MLRCKDVTRILGGEELERAPWTRRLAVRFHLLLCVHCRRYAGQLREIGKGARRILGARPAEAEEATLSRLERVILEGAGCGPAPGVETPDRPEEDGPSSGAPPSS